MASVYDAGRSLSDETLSAWMAAVGEHLRGSVGPILDLGSGTGRFSKALADSFGAVLAVEPAKAMRDRAPVVGGAMKLSARAEALPFRSQTVSSVWASQVIHHVALDEAVQELRRVVSPGGTVLLRGAFGLTGEQAPLARYFPSAIAFAERTFPSFVRIRAAFERGGWRLRAHEGLVQEIAPNLRELHRRTSQRADSALAAISDREFEAGLARLAHDAAQDVHPSPIVEAMDLVVFE